MICQTTPGVDLGMQPAYVEYGSSEWRNRYPFAQIPHSVSCFAGRVVLVLTKLSWMYVQILNLEFLQNILIWCWKSQVFTKSFSFCFYSNSLFLGSLPPSQLVNLLRMITLTHILCAQLKLKLRLDKAFPYSPCPLGKCWILRFFEKVTSPLTFA